MDKSLAPLIAFFAAVILLTVVIIHSGNETEKLQQQREHEMAPSMQLNSFETDKAIFTAKQPETIAEDALINSASSLKKVKKLLAEEKQSEAEDLLKTLLVFEPENMNALSLLGGILYYSQRYKEAESVFRRQILIDPDNHYAFNHLGSALARQQKFPEAIETTGKALEIAPDSADSHINIAGMYAIIDDKQAAMVHFRRAYELIGSSILPLSYDQSFNNIRAVPEFQSLVRAAKAAQLQKTLESSNPEEPEAGLKNK